MNFLEILGLLTLGWLGFGILALLLTGILEAANFKTTLFKEWKDSYSVVGCVLCLFMGVLSFAIACDDIKKFINKSQ